jgi:hypothetical protein
VLTNMKKNVSTMTRTRHWSISFGCILAHTCVRIQLKRRIKLGTITLHEFTLILLHIKDVYTLSINVKNQKSLNCVY